MTQAVSPSVLRRRLGARLRALREAACKSVEDVAGVLKVDPSSVRRIERGNVRLRQQDFVALCKFYDLDEPARDELAEIMADSESGGRGWWSVHGGNVSKAYLNYVGLESGATEVRDFEATVVPGLLQTRDYAEALLQTRIPKLSPEEVATRVNFRMRRQDKVKDGSLTLTAIIDEAVLFRQVGGEDTWLVQMEALERAATWPNVTLLVLPFEAEAHPGQLGSFVCLQFAKDPTIAYVESAAGDLFLDPPGATTYELTFEELRLHSLDQSDSVARIRRALQSM